MPRPTTLALWTLLFALTACSHAGTGENGDGGASGDVDLAEAWSGNLAGQGQPTSITISPSPAVVDVTVTDGVVMASPLAFTAADEHGNPVVASWTLDRGELGSFTTGSGTFNANGKNAGKAKVTATVGFVQATADLDVRIRAVNYGANMTSGTGPQAPDPAPPGGYNGVGGVSLGGPPDTATMTLLDAGTGTDAAFKILYPYEGTVWPRGMLAPLLQWSVPAGFHAKGLYVHLSQGSFDWKGYYAGTDLVNSPVDAAVWKMATNNNGGDPLVVEIKITDGTNVLGPITQSWKIAGSRLRGTVYYNTYTSQLNPGGNADGNGGVLKINPGAFAPEMAVPSLTGTCHVCHEVSSDGSQLFVATSINSDIGKVFDLVNPDNNPVDYADGTFTYGGIYPDGSMALLNAKENYHAWNGDSKLYQRSGVTDMAAAGLTGVVSEAVTPSFSPDGRRSAFAFWAGAGANGVVPGEGVLTALDFECGQTASSVACTGSPGFFGLRELYKDSTAGHYVGWPSFTPDSRAVVFQRSTTGAANDGSPLNTRNGAQAELWIADVPDQNGTPRFSPTPLCRANGLDETCTTSYLPTNGTHPGDEHLNFEPNVTPIAAGGYYWVVFTTRRLYGNVATTEPYFPKQGDGTPTSPPTKKLWVAAIEQNPTPGKDPSHPAFYLPGQEIMSGNMRGFWVRDACMPNENSCETGDECCSGYCNDIDGALKCGDKPTGCIPEYGKCTYDSDCCGTGQLSCINNLCVQGAQIL